jgi:hypothetical protein
VFSPGYRLRRPHLLPAHLRPRGPIGGQLTEHPTYLIYRPVGWKAEEKYPLVFALSPTGDARSMISAWSSVADRHHWKTKWIEFSGGHTMAPAPVYEAVAV